MCLTFAPDTSAVEHGPKKPSKSPLAFAPLGALSGPQRRIRVCVGLCILKLDIQSTNGQIERFKGVKSCFFPSYADPPCHTTVANSEDRIRIYLYQAVRRDSVVVVTGIGEKECHVDGSNRSCADGK